MMNASWLLAHPIISTLLLGGFWVVWWSLDWMDVVTCWTTPVQVQTEGYSVLSTDLRPRCRIH
jgi:hypothetical protein